MKEVEFKDKASILIKNLSSNTCHHLIRALHKKMNFGTRVFCNGIVKLSHVKGNGFTQSKNHSTPPPPDQAIIETCEPTKCETCLSTPATLIQLSLNHYINLFVQDNHELLDREKPSYKAQSIN